MSSKTVLITGGSRGIGRSMAEAFADRGYNVAVTGRNDAKLNEVTTAIPGCIALNADVADPAQTLSVVKTVTDKFGPVDVLINNAGIGGDEHGPQNLVDTDAETWWRVQETNVKGPMLYSKAVLPSMIERGTGVIINVGSFIAIRPSDRATAYATSKVALARFTDCLALEVADHGVQVFCVSPGLVMTDMTRALPFIDEIPEHAFFQPEDMASVANELATGNYGALNGRFLHVSDDLQELLGNSERLEQNRLLQLSLHGLEGLIE